MSLEALYNDAAASTYVGKVRTTQEASADTTSGVNFLDGTRRSRNNDTADEFQKEFTRNEPGSNVAGGAQPPVGLGKSTSVVTGGLSRWTNKAIKLAFNASSGEGPASLVKGFYHTPTTFRVKKFGDSSANIHNYIPTNGYTTANSFARVRAVSGPTSY